MALPWTEAAYGNYKHAAMRFALAGLGSVRSQQTEAGAPLTALILNSSTPAVSASFSSLSAKMRCSSCWVMKQGGKGAGGRHQLNGPFG